MENEVALEPRLETRLAAWVALTEQKRRLEGELRTVQDRLTVTEPDLLEDLALAGVQSVKLNGFTVFRAREFFCRAKEGVGKEQLIAAFRNAGLEHAVGIQYQTLRALAKEWSELGEEPPDVVKNVVDMGDSYRLRTRKG